MAIATAGIIDQNWANALREIISGDHYVDYYIEAINKGNNIPIDSADAEAIRGDLIFIDSITGLKFRETQNINAGDIIFTQVDNQFFDNPIDKGTLGYIELLTDEYGSYFNIVYSDNENTWPYDNITIWHEIGHALGLDHPYGDGFNPNFNSHDTIMSYNVPWATIQSKSESDIAALKFLWGEAGTNYDALGTYSSTTSSIDNVIKGTNKKDKLKGTNKKDKIIGKGGGDKILGKGGDDIIDSGKWYKDDKIDKIKGGSGADTFIIKDGYWAYIKDFTVFEDKLDVSGLSGGLDWDIEGNRTYVWDNNGDEVARIPGAIDLSQANII